MDILNYSRMYCRLLCFDRLCVRQMDKMKEFNKRYQESDQNNDALNIHSRSVSMEDATRNTVDSPTSSPRSTKRERRNSLLGNILKRGNSSSGLTSTTTPTTTESSIGDLNVVKRKSSVGKGLEVYSKDHDEMMKILRNIDKNTTNTYHLMVSLSNACKPTKRESSQDGYINVATQEESIEYYTETPVSCCIIT
jgi:hypothetical protein